ncbi:hypothetical protein [Marinomonas lutimaris]|uniref:hypothetical protein n=1 Tax=Marinomonas lutimaris TaxID=2846746 RepID=UPI001CA5F001|nr:hypothetical protein [Marinomonas lutimaris]
MNIPDYKFKEWVPFDSYKEIDGVGFPGVYILAHFTRKPYSEPCTSSSNIVYVGETTGQTISKRLYQFKQSAFLRKRAHSGGWSYSDKYLKGKISRESPNKLYVAILPVDRPHKESKAYIKLVERLVIWDFFQKNKAYPSCNTA